MPFIFDGWFDPWLWGAGPIALSILVSKLPFCVEGPKIHALAFKAMHRETFSRPAILACSDERFNPPTDYRLQALVANDLRLAIGPVEHRDRAVDVVGHLRTFFAGFLFAFVFFAAFWLAFSSSPFVLG